VEGAASRSEQHSSLVIDRSHRDRTKALNAHYEEQQPKRIGRMRAVGVHDPRGNRPPRARAGARARWVVCLDRGRLLAPPFGEAKGGRNMLPAGATQLATHATEAIENEQPQDSGSRPRSNQGAQCALPNTPAETYRQAACGRCPRSARQPPSAVKCAGLCAAGRLLGKPAPALSRGGRLLAEAPHAMRVGP